MAEDVTSIPSSKLRGSLAEILRRIDDGESFVITHYDRAVAILSPAEVVPAPVQAAATAALAAGTAGTAGTAEEYAAVALGNAQEVCRLLVVQAHLGNALAALTDACLAADEAGDLAPEIDGSMLDNAEAAIAMIDRFKPVRSAAASQSPPESDSSREEIRPSALPLTGEGGE